MPLSRGLKGWKIKIIAMLDASYRSIDGKVRSIEGRVIFLSDSINSTPLDSKARKISQVCKSMKTAKTRAADKAMDKAIYFAQLIKEIYIKSQVLRPDSSGGIHG